MEVGSGVLQSSVSDVPRPIAIVPAVAFPIGLVCTATEVAGADAPKNKRHV